MSTETVPNKEMIRKHYRALNHNKQTEMRFIQEDRGDGPTLLPIRRFIESEDDFVNLATQLNKDNNVYVGYNERLPDKGLKTDVISCKYYIIDLDSKDENVFNIIKRKLEEIEIYPSFTIHTGGGWHFYFPIEEIKDNNKITSFLNKCKFVLTKLHKAVDPKVYDASRILRVWGTINIKKDRDNALTTIIEENEPTKTSKEHNYYHILDCYEEIQKQTSPTKNTTPTTKLDYKIDLFDYLFKNPLLKENISKNDILFKNCAIYYFLKYGYNDEGKTNLSKFAMKHKHPASEILGWYEKAKSGELNEFSMGELVNWNKKHKLGLDEYMKEISVDMTADKYSDIKKSIVSAKDLITKDFPEPTWLIHHIIQDDATAVAAGKGGTLKSFTVLDMCLSMISGKKWLDTFDTKPVKVLWLDEENGLRKIKKRLLQLIHGRYEGCDLSKIMFCSYNSFKIDTDTGRDILKKLLLDFQPDMVVLDSLLRFTSGEEDKAKDAAQFYDCLKATKIEKPLATLIIHHMTKGGNGQDIDGVRGSGDWINMADAVYTIKKDTKDNNLYTLKMVKMRDMSLDDIKPFNIRAVDEDVLEDEENVYPYKYVKFVMSEYEEDEDKGSGMKLIDCKNDIIEWLKTNNSTEFKAGELLSAMIENKHTEKTHDRARTIIIDDGIIESTKKGYYTVDMDMLDNYMM